MRIHRLELTAFGPFPGTEVVDFDRLNAAGLFLLTGPTGAGKTSILDAICFALYGAVPGDRNGAKAFKSDHAGPDAVPSVLLELTVRERRLRLRRQPGWSRPSRRAKSGHVEEKSKASIEEYVDGRWHAHSNRVDEVGHLVSTLLGMNKDQFCQVVMLPQGEFQTFLSAGAKERHDVLESLFRTHRFQAIERWLSEHRRSLEVSSRETEAELDRLLARADEVLAGIGEESLSADAATRSTYHVALQELQLRGAHVAASAACAVADEARLSETAKAVQHDLDAARTLVDLQQRHRDAQNRWDELMSAAPEVRRREREVLLARRAAAFEPLLDLVVEAKELATTTRAAAVTAEKTLLDELPAPKAEVSLKVEDQTDDLRHELARLDALAETEREIDAATVTLASLESDLADDRYHEVVLVTAMSLQPDLVAAARADLATASDAESRLPAVRDGVHSAAAVQAAARLAVVTTAQVSEVESALLSARELRADARDTRLDVRERRVAGIAAELGATLAEGEPCPVCGSADHPQLAASNDFTTRAEDEATAERVVQEADHTVGRLELRRERLRAERTAADHAAAGLTSAVADHALLAAESRQTEVATVAAGVAGHRKRLAGLEAELAEQYRELSATRASLHTREAQWTHVMAARQQLQRRLQDAMGADASLAERRAVVRRRLDSTVAWGLAARAHSEAAEVLATAITRLDRLVADSVFATVDQVRDAVRTETHIASGEALNRAHATETATSEKALADTNLVRAGQAPPPDLDTLVGVAEQAKACSAAATARACAWESALTRLDILTSQLDAGVGRWQPLHERRVVADHVAAMVAGTAKDNTSKTKLSHYVLAARLEQVVSAANVRLRGICGGRYELEHTLLRGVGDARGGLGLRVLDTYTGSRRDPATLSGGETFYVSLALALGLADLVNNEVGGSELSTLFVDEGFGTLDADTLDEVMDELDGLRSGGRAVGLVSHLAELKIRVPVQLSVIRSPRGSRLDDSR